MSPSRRLLVYARPYRRAFLLGLAAVVCTQAVALVAPLVLQAAIDDLTAGATGAKFLAYGGLLLAIGVVSSLFRFLARRLLLGASRHIEYDIRNDVFARLLRLPLAYFQAHRTGDLMSRATNDLNAVRVMTGYALIFFANTALVLVVALTVMAAIDARLALLALLPLPLVSLTVKISESAIHKRSARIQAQLAEMSVVAQEALAGVRLLRAYRQEAAVLDRFHRANVEHFKRNRALIVLQGAFFPSMSFFFGLAALVVLWAGSREVIRGRLTLGELVAFNAYLTMLSWPMVAFGWATNLLQRGMASWQRIVEVLDARPGNADDQRGSSVSCRASLARPGIRGEIELRDLVFGYTGAPVLDHVSARVEAGQTAALVGPTGSGKSTLVSLLARLHDPPPGTVFIDGADVRELPLDVLRGAIGFVQQEPFLFSDTIAGNIAFGLDARRTPPERDAEAPAQRSRRDAAVPGDRRFLRIMTAAAIAGLDKDVADFPERYDTLIGEHGLTLSGGQRQRTALARAVALDPRILILDDALSSVDAATEDDILSRLRGVMRERTSIIVSHRIAAVRGADVIFVLDRGRIIERGTDAELLARRGLYYRLHTRQQLEEELAAS